MRIGWSPRVILVPVSGPAVTTSVRGPRGPFFLAGVARGGTEATRPARPPKRSARTMRKAAKMNSHSSSRKPKRKICSTISAVMRPPHRWPAGPPPPPAATSRPPPPGGRPAPPPPPAAPPPPSLPVAQTRGAEADHVSVGERLPADPPAVDQRAVGRAEVFGDRRAAVQDDVDVLAADAGVGQPD